MEFDSKLASVRGLLNCQKRIHGSLENLGSDDTKKLEDIKSEVQTFIKNEKFDENDLGRLYFFLLLNTKRFEEYSSSLACDADFGHLVAALPVISDALFIEIVTKLKLDKFLYQSIVSLPPVFALEVIDMASILFKGCYKRYPFEMLQYSEILLKAILVKLFLLESLSTQSLKIEEENMHCITPFHDPEVNRELCTNIKLKFFEYFQKFIANYSSTKPDDYTSMGKNKLNYFSACLIKSILGVVKTCCKHYLDYEAVYKDSDLNELFKVSSFDMNLKELPKIPPIENIKETCLDVVLSSFLSNAKCVTISLWMSWLELEEFTDENLQMTIGNEIYHCLQYLNDERIEGVVNNRLYTDLMSIVTNMAVKPMDEEDEMRSADFETIMKNMNNPSKRQEKWLGLLISHENFKADTETLKTIEEKSTIIVQRDVETLLFKCAAFLESSLDNSNITQENCELFKKVTLLAVSNFHIDHQMEILDKFLKEKGITNILRLNEFEASMVELFNKAVDENDRIPMELSSQFLRLALQSPEELLEKILSEAQSSRAQGKFLIKILKHLEPICSYQSEGNGPILISAILIKIKYLSTKSESEKENFLSFIVDLVNKFIISPEDFSNKYLWPELSDAAEQSDHSSMLLLLELTEKFIDGSVIVPDIQMSVPVCIVLLCQIVNKFRTTLTTFDVKSVAICDKAIDVLLLYADTLNIDCEEEDLMSWMVSELKQVDILMQTHVMSYVNDSPFNYLMGSNGRELYWLRCMFCDLNEDVSFLEDDNRPFFSRVLLKALPCLTLREWRMFFDNLTSKDDPSSVTNLFLCCAEVFLILHSSVVPNLNGEEFDSRKSEATLNCLSYIVKNLITILQELIIPSANSLDRDETSEIFLKLCFILNEFPRAVKDEEEFIWLKILQDLIAAANLPKKTDEISDLTASKRFCAGIAMITNNDLRSCLYKYLRSCVYDE